MTTFVLKSNLGFNVFSNWYWISSFPMSWNYIERCMRVERLSFKLRVFHEIDKIRIYYNMTYKMVKLIFLAMLLIPSLAVRTKRYDANKVILWFEFYPEVAIKATNSENYIFWRFQLCKARKQRWTSICDYEIFFFHGKKVCIHIIFFETILKYRPSLFKPYIGWLPYMLYWNKFNKIYWNSFA